MLFGKQMKIAARLEPWRRAIDLMFGFKDLETGEIDAAQPMILSRLNPGDAVPSFATLGLEDAQLLMDELWRCGLRPTEGTGSAGAFAAMEKHLADLRAITFHRLGIK